MTEPHRQLSLPVHLLYPENHSLGEWFKRGCCR